MNNWKDAIYLIKRTETIKDEDGFMKISEEKSDLIAANIIGVTRAEAEHANQLGYTADLEVEIMYVNYNNQELLETEDKKRYVINRTYPKSSEILILTCSDVSKGSYGSIS